MPERPVHISATGQRRELDGVGHLLQDAFGADGGGFFEPHRRTRPECEEGLLTDGAGPHPVITGNLVAVVGGEMVIVDGGTAGGVARWCRATSTGGPPSSRAQITTSSVPS